MGRIVAVATAPFGQEFTVRNHPDTGQQGFFFQSQAVVYWYGLHTHAAELCKLVNGHCCLHAPSEHALKDADMVLRLDKDALIERLCEHGIGHDDPDSLAFLKSIGIDYYGSHGCDGCCGELDDVLVGV